MSTTKALASLYKAISGSESKHKNNITKLLADIYKAITGKSTTKNNPSKIISDLADGWSKHAVRQETVSGTLDDPWGNFDLEELMDALAYDGQNASAYIIIDATAVGQSSVESYIYLDGSPELFVTSGASSDLDGFYAAWNSSGTLTASKMSVSGTPVDISSFASSLPTTLKVIWHPLPTT